MKKPLIVNVFENCEHLRTNTDCIAIWNIPREYAEASKDWACGKEISHLNIYCELSHDATKYLLSRVRSPNCRPYIMASAHWGAMGKTMLPYRPTDSMQTLEEWIEEAYDVDQA
jgi:hypothetical protein